MAVENNVSIKNNTTFSQIKTTNNQVQYRTNPNAVDKTPDKDTVNIAGKNFKKKNLWFAAGGTLLAIAGAILIGGKMRSTAFNNIHLPENIDFNPAKTIEEAKEFGKNILGIKKYKNIDNLEVLNYINESLVKVSNTQKGNCFMPSRIIGRANMGNAIAAMSGGMKGVKGHDLHVNLDYINNIDNKITETIEVLKNKGWLRYDQSNASYKLPLIYNKNDCNKLENLLNNYNKNSSLVDKLSLANGINRVGEFVGRTNNPIQIIKENFIGLSQVKYKGTLYTLEELSKLEKQAQGDCMCNLLRQKPMRINDISPYCAIAHEMGHAQHLHSAGLELYTQMGKLDEIPKDISKTVINDFLKPDKQQIAEQVSMYAKESPLEFVAEVFSGCITGNKYSKEVMNLYEFYKGPKI